MGGQFSLRILTISSLALIIEIDLLPLVVPKLVRGLRP